MILTHESLLFDDTQPASCASSIGKQFCVFPVVLSVYELLQLSAYSLANHSIELLQCESSFVRKLTCSTCCPHWPQVLNGVNLASFSLVDCAQTLLGQRLEVVPARCIAAWAGLATTMPK